MTRYAMKAIVLGVFAIGFSGLLMAAATLPGPAPAQVRLGSGGAAVMPAVNTAQVRPVTVPAVSAGATAPAGNPPPWFGRGVKVFDDEFNGTTLDTSRWTSCYPWGDCTNRGNNELQWYTPQNVRVGGGEADLTAVHQGLVTPLGHFDFTSGLIQTSGHFSFTYGYSEIRAWLPAGKGFWPAFWLLPSDLSWPPEIDAMEAAGSRPSSVSMTVHFGASQQDGTDFNGPDYTAGWHTFGVDWEPDHLTWYIDGVARKSVRITSEIPTKPMYLIVNLAIDGNDPPNLMTPFPSSLRIDYVRVWRH